MRRLIAALVLALALETAPVHAGVQITIYNDNLALVKDTRDLEYQRGTFDLSFTDVASAIDATSVSFSAVQSPGSVNLLEQNYRYDLVSSEKILEKYIDKSIRVLTKEGKLHEGTLLSSDGMALTLRMGDGGLVIVSRAEVADLTFPSLPEGLITRPTLVWKLNSELDGKHASEVRYLTTQISWNAQYVATVAADETSLDLAGWVSIDNHSGATYDDAKIKLIAGDVNRVRPPMPQERYKTAMALGAADAGFEERAFFEYHLYTLQRPSTIRDNEIKQLSLFDPARVKAKKIFTYDGSRDATKVRVSMEFMNSAEAGLGIPLPRGTIRVMKADTDGSLEFVGEDQIDHTPKDEKVRALLGNAFDVVGERVQKAHRQVSERVAEEDFEIKLRNHKTEDIVVTVIEHGWGDWTITQQSHTNTKKDAGKAEWEIPVKADGEAILTYTARRVW